MSNFSNIWNLLNNKEKENCLIDSIQYRKNTLQEPPKSIVDVEYTCTEDKCDLETVMKSIKNSADLTAYGTDKVLENVVDIMNKNQDEYMLSKMEAFEISDYDKNYVRFKRNDSNGKPGIVGYISYDTLIYKCTSIWDVKRYVNFYNNLAPVKNYEIENKYCALM